MSDIDEMRSCVYSWLQSVRLGWLEAKRLEEEICGLRDRLDGLSSAQGDSVSGSSGGCGLEAGILRLSQLEDRWRESVEACSKAYVDAYELCAKGEGTYAVWLHVVERLTWREAGCELGYSERTMKRMGHEGIAVLYENMPKF